MEVTFTRRPRPISRQFSPVSLDLSPIHFELDSEIKRLRTTGNRLKAVKAQKARTRERICTLFRKLFRFNNRLNIFRLSESKGKQRWSKSHTTESLFQAWLAVCAQTVDPESCL
jgi:hypothetical protein